jgi:tetratricopeptide (TPR) repeat protein
MVTNKKRWWRQMQFLLAAIALAWLTGCTPAGPRALLEGKRLIEQGRYAEAVDELKVATSLLATNAQAWNYLGLAYHHAGQPANAADAYERALSLNHDLVPVHYNLGCLLLEQNRPDVVERARNELTAYIMREGTSLDGWLKLGTAQLRLGELSAAEASFREVLKMNSQNVEAWNDLGLVQLQRRRYRDASTYFNSALKLQPNYGPALLNQAVTEIYLNNRPMALQKYQEFLAANPHDTKWDAVNAAAQQLDSELNPPTRFSTNNPLLAANPPTNNQPRPVAAPTNPTHPEIIASIPKPTPATQSRPPADNSGNPEVVHLPDAVLIKPANSGTTATTPTPVATSNGVLGEPPETTPTPPPKPEKRGFFQRINPMTLFHHDTKPATVDPGPANKVAIPSADSVVTSTPVTTPEPPRPIVIPRYPYLSPMRPPGGNREEAERFLAQGGAAQRDQRLKDAVALYRSAALADPSYFEAQSSLGLAAFNYGDLPLSLRAFELALAIKPDSFSARYNFGLALKQANYIQDAAEELERLAASKTTGEPPAHLALVHLTLANLYAEQFHQTRLARAHYLKVLELDPHNPQGTSIRYWLQDNP